MKNIKRFLSENFQFLEVKFSMYLNRRGFVMESSFDYPLLLFMEENKIMLVLSFETHNCR